MTWISNTLKNLQRTVDGYIETVNIGGSCVCICNEEGKLKKLEPNFRIGDGMWIDMICGTAIIVGIDGEGFCDIPISMPTWKKLLASWGN